MFFLVLLIGLVTSFLSNLTGGGGSIIQLPALQLLGVSPATAIGTIHLGALGLVIGSSIGSKNKGVVRRDYLIPLIIAAVLASIAGPLLNFRFDSEQVKVISSVIIVITACASLASWRLASKARQVSKLQVAIGCVLYFLTTTFVAGFGSGIGILSNYVLIGLLGMTALETVSTRRIVGLVAVPIQLLLFALHQHVNFAFGIALLVGSLIGGYFGMHTAIKKGNEFVKWGMAIVSLLLVGSLFV